MPGFAPAQATFNDDPAESAPVWFTIQYARAQAFRGSWRSPARASARIQSVIETKNWPRSRKRTYDDERRHRRALPASMTRGWPSATFLASSEALTSPSLQLRGSDDSKQVPVFGHHGRNFYINLANSATRLGPGHASQCPHDFRSSDGNRCRYQ